MATTREARLSESLKPHEVVTLSSARPLAALQTPPPGWPPSLSPLVVPPKEKQCGVRPLGEGPRSRLSGLVLPIGRPEARIPVQAAWSGVVLGSSSMWVRTWTGPGTGYRARWDPGGLTLCPRATGSPAANSISQGAPGSHCLPASLCQSEPSPESRKTGTVRASVVSASLRPHGL